MPNFRPGDTDPIVIPPMQDILDQFRNEVIFESTKAKITELINELGKQAKKMYQAGKQTWWDMQKHKEMVPYGVRYDCRSELGRPDTLKNHECREASFSFINEGDTPIINGNTPLVYKSGESL